MIQPDATQSGGEIARKKLSTIAPLGLSLVLLASIGRASPQTKPHSQIKPHPQAKTPIPAPTFILPRLDPGMSHKPASPDWGIRRMPKDWGSRSAPLQARLRMLLLRRQHLLRKHSPRSPEVRRLDQQIAAVRRELARQKKPGVVLLGSKRV